MKGFKLKIIGIALYELGLLMAAFALYFNSGLNTVHLIIVFGYFLGFYWVWQTAKQMILTSNIDTLPPDEEDDLSLPKPEMRKALDEVFELNKVGENV